MAGLEGLGKDDLKRVLDIRAAVADVKLQQQLKDLLIYKMKQQNQQKQQQKLLKVKLNN